MKYLGVEFSAKITTSCLEYEITNSADMRSLHTHLVIFVMFTNIFIIKQSNISVPKDTKNKYILKIFFIESLNDILI